MRIEGSACCVSMACTLKGKLTGHTVETVLFRVPPATPSRPRPSPPVAGGIATEPDPTLRTPSVTVSELLLPGSSFSSISMLLVSSRESKSSGCTSPAFCSADREMPRNNPYMELQRRSRRGSSKAETASETSMVSGSEASSERIWLKTSAEFQLKIMPKSAERVDISPRACSKRRSISTGGGVHRA